jgi:quaternary ammonium compound-resistance protein SugE
MAWLVLVVSGVLEAVWAVALGRSEGFSRLVPSLVFGVGLVLSMGGLAYAMRTLPVGTAYAVWVGIGAVGAAAVGIVWHGDPAPPLRLAFLALLVVSVAGLKVTSGH